MGKQKSNRIAVLGWTLIVLLPSLLLFAIGEIVLRLIPPDPQVLLDIVTETSDARRYILKPNSRTTFRGFYDPMPQPISWQVNEDGIRSNGPIENKGERFRILTYGDSETFGWSVQFKDTWQRRMEAIDDRMQVLNLGVPGYNIENVADHMELTAPPLEPDLIIYLFHKNDFYEPLSVSPILSQSELYVHIQIAIYALSAGRRHAWRKTPEAYRFVSAQIRRMLEVSKRINVPFIIAFRHWKYRGILDKKFWGDDALESATSLPRSDVFSVKVVNIESAVEEFPRLDYHLIEPAHRALAAYLCEFLSGSANSGCHWSGSTPRNLQGR